MDCPSCGLTNPAESLKCDCGYDFVAAQPAEYPGWPVTLTWGQSVAAFWSIAWPAWLGVWALTMVATTLLTGDLLHTHLNAVSIVSNLAVLAAQAPLTRRLVTKNYSSFRIYVVRPDGTRHRYLSPRDGLPVCFWILAPQVVLLVSVPLLLWLLANTIPAKSAQSLVTLSVWIRLLVVGPWAVRLALRVDHPGFRLQALGFRR